VFLPLNGLDQGFDAHATARLVLESLKMARIISLCRKHGLYLVLAISPAAGVVLPSRDRRPQRLETV
jgi:hypothetical protein